MNKYTIEDYWIDRIALWIADAIRYGIPTLILAAIFGAVVFWLGV